MRKKSERSFRMRKRLRLIGYGASLAILVVVFSFALFIRTVGASPDFSLNGSTGFANGIQVGAKRGLPMDCAVACGGGCCPSGDCCTSDGRCLSQQSTHAWCNQMNQECDDWCGKNCTTNSCLLCCDEHWKTCNDNVNACQTYYWQACGCQ